MSLSIHSIDRAITAGSVHNILNLDKMRAAVGYDQLQEIEHQFQIAIEGTATTNLTWEVFDLAFDVEFFFAPQQRDSPLTVPHFTYGASVTGETTDTANPNGVVGVLASVIGWSQDDRTAITGSKLAVGVFCGGPSSDTTVDFDGYLHLTFQGFGAPGGADGGDNNTITNVGV